MVLPSNVTPLLVAVFATLTQITMLLLDGRQKADWDVVCEPWYDFVSASVVQRQSVDMDELVDHTCRYISVCEVTEAIACAVLGARSRINYARALAVGIAAGTVGTPSRRNIRYVDSCDADCGAA